MTLFKQAAIGDDSIVMSGFTLNKIKYNKLTDIMKSEPFGLVTQKTKPLEKKCDFCLNHNLNEFKWPLISKAPEPKSAGEIIWIV